MKKLFALKNRKGFTLVELMVVVAIMGILVAVAIPVYNGVTEKAELSTCQANQRTIDSAIMMYNIDAPSASKITTTTPAVDLKTKLTGGTTKYLVEMPNCPSAVAADIAGANGTYTVNAAGKAACAIAETTTAGKHNAVKGNAGK